MSASAPNNVPTTTPSMELAAVSKAPFYRAPEAVQTIFAVTFAAACGPLLAGIVLFGWRAIVVTIISVCSCAVIERGYYTVTRTPALMGRSHAYLTGLLLALTLPPFAPWYVPLIAAAFAIIVGKVIFGGVGHFLWQPALVGWLAVMVVFPGVMKQQHWAILDQDHMVTGDITLTDPAQKLHDWPRSQTSDNAHAFKVRPPSAILLELGNSEEPAFSAIASREHHRPEAYGDDPPPDESTLDLKRLKPLVIMEMPRIHELLYGARAGAIGETCVIAIIVFGIYLIYRHYVKWQLPITFILAAAIVVSIAPIHLARSDGQAFTVWFPLFAEGPDVGFAYVSYQLLCGELMLAAFFLATEMTCRPSTTGGQVIFGVSCGVLAMCLRIFLQVPYACFMAILAINTFTPTIDALWRPRVLGQRHWLIRLVARKQR